jgi:hypothetical protein
MPNLKMDVYTQSTGVQLTLSWNNEQEYQRAKEFLASLGASCISQGEPSSGKPEFVYLENTKQLEALYEFRRSL